MTESSRSALYPREPSWVPSALYSPEDRGTYSSHLEAISLGVLPPTWPISALQNPRRTEPSLGLPLDRIRLCLCVPRFTDPHVVCLVHSLHTAAETLGKMEPIVESDWASHCFANSRTNGQLPSELAFLCCSLIKPQSYTM